MDKKLKDSIAVRLYEDKISDKAFESLKQHNHFNRGFKKDFAQEMIIQFYEIEDDKLDSIYEQDGYNGICSFYFRMCIFQLLARSNKMHVKWLGYKNMFVDLEYLSGLCEFGTNRFNTNVLDMEDYNEQLYNNEEIVEEENNEEENEDIDEIY